MQDHILEYFSIRLGLYLCIIMKYDILDMNLDII